MAIAALRKNKTKAKGLATVEMALVLPILCLLTFGVMEYGWMFLKAQQINNAARQGARVAITLDATTEQVNLAISKLMTNAKMDSSGYTTKITPGVSGLAAGQDITVEVSVPYENVDLLGLPFLPVPDSLKASVTMAKEGL